MDEFLNSYWTHAAACVSIEVVGNWSWRIEIDAKKVFLSFIRGIFFSCSSIFGRPKIFSTYLDKVKKKTRDEIARVISLREELRCSGG